MFTMFLLDTSDEKHQQQLDNLPTYEPSSATTEAEDDDDEPPAKGKRKAPCVS